MQTTSRVIGGTVVVLAAFACATTATLSRAEVSPAVGCAGLPDHATLRASLQAIIREGKDANTGLGNNEWATVVDRDGLVCAVVFSGSNRGSQWPGSRAISAEKAVTANALSSPDFALSTANLFFASQPGQSLYSLVTSSTPNPAAAYAGPATDFGQATDPYVGKAIGGVIVFGGGLALYDGDGKLLGGLGVSGDTSCADHIIAWKLRHSLLLDAVPAGVGPESSDNMILDITGAESVSGFGHPSCKGGKPSDDLIRKLPSLFPTGRKR